MNMKYLYYMSKIVCMHGIHIKQNLSVFDTVVHDSLKPFTCTEVTLFLSHSPICLLVVIETFTEAIYTDHALQSDCILCT